FDIVEIEAHGAAVTIEQEPRQRSRQHHGIAHRDVGRGATQFRRGPGDRHYTRGAGKLGDVKADLRRAIGWASNDTGIERERLLRRRAALQLRTGAVTAGLELAARALHAVDQLPIEVADFGRKATLAEIVIVRCRRRVIGEVEDYDIDCGDDDLGVLAGIK